MAGYGKPAPDGVERRSRSGARAGSPDAGGVRPPLPRWPLRVEAGLEVAAAGEVFSYGEQGLLRREAYEVAAKVLAPQQVAGYRVYPVVIRQTVAGERLEKISWLDEAGMELAVYTRTDQPPMTSRQWILDGPGPLNLADLQELLRALS